MSESQRQNPLDRVLSIEIARVTERAAVAAALWRGRGDEKAADAAAVELINDSDATIIARSSRGVWATNTSGAPCQ